MQGFIVYYYVLQNSWCYNYNWYLYVWVPYNKLYIFGNMTFNLTFIIDFRWRYTIMYIILEKHWSALFYIISAAVSALFTFIFWISKRKSNYPFNSNVIVGKKVVCIFTMSWDCSSKQTQYLYKIYPLFICVKRKFK